MNQSVELGGRLVEKLVLLTIDGLEHHSRRVLNVLGDFRRAPDSELHGRFAHLILLFFRVQQAVLDEKGLHLGVVFSEEVLDVFHIGLHLWNETFRGQAQAARAVRLDRLVESLALTLVDWVEQAVAVQFDLVDRLVPLVITELLLLEDEVVHLIDQVRTGLIIL